MHVLDDILHELEEEKKALAQEICGDVSSFETYKRLSGMLEGLERAQWKVRNYRDRIEENEKGDPLKNERKFS